MRIDVQPVTLASAKKSWTLSDYGFLYLRKMKLFVNNLAQNRTQFHGETYYQKDELLFVFKLQVQKVV